MLRFKLIHYTSGWSVGPTVELSALPSAGMLVKADGPEAIDLGENIYYVDNVMLGDGGDNYLFVRPYEGYGATTPLTEADRIEAAIKDLSEAIDNMGDNIISRLDD